MDGRRRLPSIMNLSTDEAEEHNLHEITFALEVMAYGDILRASKCECRVGAFILISCFIDYLAGFRSGKRAIKDDYLGFIEKYFPKEYDPRKIYEDLRCGLVHNYTEGGSYSLTYGHPDLHLKPDGERVYLNLENLIRDTEKAMKQFLAEMNALPSLRKKALQRYSNGGLLRAYSE